MIHLTCSVKLIARTLLLSIRFPIETARQSSDLDVVDERKVDQIEAELVNYRVDVAGLQETKWFGRGVCI